MHHNEIVTIQPGSFEENTALIELGLYNNLLQTLPESMFHPQNRPHDLNLFEVSDNPVSCGGSLCWLKHADGTWITVDWPGGVVCTGGDLDGMTWDTLTVEDLNCDETGESNSNVGGHS